MKKNCVICGANFEARTDHQIYCSLKCAGVVKNARARERNLAKRMENAKKVACKICGKEFYPEGNQKVYCSRECYHEAKIEFTRNFRLKNKENSVHRKLNCKYCGKEFEATRRDRIFCSHECALKANHRKAEQEKICANCGKTFKTTQDSVTLCKSCRKEIKRAKKVITNPKKVITTPKKVITNPEKPKKFKPQKLIKACEWCGRYFKTYHDSRLYCCPECQEIAEIYYGK